MGVVGRCAHRVTASVEFWERGVKEESWEASFTGKEYYLLVHYRAVRRVRRGEYSVRSKERPNWEILYCHRREEMDYEWYLGGLFHRCGEDWRERVEWNFLARD